MPKSKLVVSSRLTVHSTGKLKVNQKSAGFSLIEILISLLFIGALLTILFTTTGSLLVRRQSNLQSVAAKIASKEIERLRNLPFTSLTNGSETDWTYPSSCNTTLYASDISSMGPKAQGKVCRNLYDYEAGASSNPIGTTTIVGVQIRVNFRNNNNQEQDIYMDTLIYQNGL